MKNCLLSISFFLILLKSFGQGIPEMNHWFFGQSAEIDFSSGSPVSGQTTSLINTHEGCSSISDSSGNLLFYTDGRMVWNKLHVLMENGDSLMGNQSSTQAALIVQRPCHKDHFYIFTTPNRTLGKLTYSEVDMSLNGGLGAVTSLKNITLGTTVSSEKIAVVWHTDYQRLWIISQQPWQANRFHVYSISSNGVDTNSIESTAGINEVMGVGYLKANSSGNLLISCNIASANILTFDRTTGIVSDKFVIPMNALPNSSNSLFYGAEFSPNGNLLYLSTLGERIYQIDLTQSTEQAVIASILEIGVVPSGSTQIGALQLGPDGKIYAAKQNTSSLACIENPDAPGIACGFTENAVQLNGTCQIGLPAFQMHYRYYFDECPYVPPVTEPEEPEKPEATLEIPNIITPNGDGTNDTFILKNTVPGQVSITIANRWGNTVFFSNTYMNDWSGEDLTDGIYFYTIWDTDSEQTFTGFVQLIR